jgi:hypothetical protein
MGMFVNSLVKTQEEDMEARRSLYMCDNMNRM